MKLRDEETGQLYECEYACDGINQDRYIKTGRMVVEDRSKWHPHHDLIVAWARGAEIQYLNPASNEWLDIMYNSPSWKVSIKYRIKPKGSCMDEWWEKYGGKYNLDTDKPFSLELSEYSEWQCHLFGSNGEGISYRPLKGQHPNWFWRKMQYICFGNKWVKDGNV